jgi:sugar lactone lactonase YvrE
MRPGDVPVTISAKGVVSMHSQYGLAAAVAMISAALLAVGAAPAAATHNAPGPSLVTSFGSPTFAESLAADRHGTLYAAVTNWDAGSGRVVRIAPDGAQTPFGEALEGGMVTGLAFDQMGGLYVGFVSFHSDTASGVYRVGANGTPAQVLSLGSDSFPNGLAFHAGYLYVSDSTIGAVWRMRPGEVASPDTPWLEDPLLAPVSDLGANGLAFRGNDLYIGVWDSGRIVRVPVTARGEPGPVTIVPGGDQTGLVEVDGIAFDARGNLYATTNTNALLRLTPAGALESLVDPSSLDYPTMPVFGTGPHAGTTLHVANGSFDGGTPNVIAFDVGEQGMRLP